jgi:hypothetical protein
MTRPYSVYFYYDMDELSMTSDEISMPAQFLQCMESSYFPPFLASDMVCYCPYHIFGVSDVVCSGCLVVVKAFQITINQTLKTGSYNALLKRKTCLVVQVDRFSAGGLQAQPRKI